jgi:DNA-binding NtrC family response regulator
MAVPKILIVDDEASILSLLRLVLESENYEVTTAVSAADAKQKLSGQGFDLVITDIRMETPTAGFDVVRAAHQALPKSPVALLTAFPVPTSDWKQAGADALFIKGTDSTLKMLEWIEGAVAPAKVNSENQQDSDQQTKKRAS